MPLKVRIWFSLTIESLSKGILLISTVSGVLCGWNYLGSEKHGRKIHFIKLVPNFNLIILYVMQGKRSVYEKSKDKYENKRKQNSSIIIMSIKLMCFLLKKTLSKIAPQLYKGK